MNFASKLMNISLQMMNFALKMTINDDFCMIKAEAYDEYGSPGQQKYVFTREFEKISYQKSWFYAHKMMIVFLMKRYTDNEIIAMMEGFAHVKTGFAGTFYAHKMICGYVSCSQNDGVCAGEMTI